MNEMEELEIITGYTDMCSVYHDFISQLGAFKAKMNILRNETQVDKRSGINAFLIS